MDRNYTVRYDTGEMFDYYKYMMYCPECGYWYDPNMLKTQESELDPVYCSHCGSEMIDIDYKIFNIIKELNEKGYKTNYCCEGHDDDISTSVPYISFSDCLSTEDHIMIMETAISFLGDLGYIVNKPNCLTIYMEYDPDQNHQFNKNKSLWLKKMKEVVKRLPYIKER